VNYDTCVETWHEGSNTISVGSPVVNEETMMMVGISALCYLESFNTYDCVTRKNLCLSSTKVFFQNTRRKKAEGELESLGKWL